jgi:hypothetical protein
MEPTHILADNFSRTILLGAFYDENSNRKVLEEFFITNLI